jgi:hypothetical protein
MIREQRSAVMYLRIVILSRNPFPDRRKYIALRFEVFTAVTMKIVVFWDTETISYFKGDTLHLYYSVQPVNAIKDLRFSRR